MLDRTESGSGEPLVFLHGYLTAGNLWRTTIERLEGRFRCVVPELPLGAHRNAVDADLSPPGLADLVVCFLDDIGLERATLIGNDTGGAIAQLVAARYPDRVERLVLTNCDALEVFPPRLFAYLKPTSYVPGAVWMLAQAMRIRAMRRLPIAYGKLTATPLPHDLTDTWVEPIHRDRGIRRDLIAVTRGIHRKHTLAAAEQLRDFQRPVLFAWGAADTLFPLALAQRLAAMLPEARIEPIPGARAFVPHDAPDALADAIKRFVG